MDLTRQFNLVVAATSESGAATFVEPPQPRIIKVPGVVEGAYLWDTGGIPNLPHGLGGSALERAFPLAGGARLGVFCFPARSAGKLNFASLPGRSIPDSDESEDAAMHRTDSIDFEYIISGKMDLELPGGKMKTVAAGHIVVMGGVPHAWKNHYDEDCIYLAVIVGAQAAG